MRQHFHFSSLSFKTLSRKCLNSDLTAYKIRVATTVPHDAVIVFARCVTFDINIIRYSCRSILSFFSGLSIKFSGRNRNDACAMPVGFSDHQARGGG